MIFHIGLNKTGSTSLAKALEILGYNVCDNCGELKEKILQNISKGIDPMGGCDFDAITDNIAVWQNFEYIYRFYPDAYYIYTPRNTEDWLISREQHVIGNQQNPNYEGSFLTVNKKAWRRLKDDYEREIASWTDQNDVNYLGLPICDGKNLWSKLCTFLGKDIPREQFPHKNKS